MPGTASTPPRPSRLVGRSEPVKITKHVIVHGRVQGVNYRESLRMEAERLTVSGWVRNRATGGVEAMVHGWPDDVSRMLDWCRQGPPGPHVTSLQANEASGDFEGFERRPSG